MEFFRSWIISNRLWISKLLLHSIAKLYWSWPSILKLTMLLILYKIKCKGRIIINFGIVIIWLYCHYRSLILYQLSHVPIFNSINGMLTMKQMKCVLLKLWRKIWTASLFYTRLSFFKIHYHSFKFATGHVIQISLSRLRPLFTFIGFGHFYFCKPE